MTVVADIPLKIPNPFGINISDDGSRVYVACINKPGDHGRVYIIDGENLVKIDSIDVGKQSYGLTWQPAP
jgi:DNA-binding beta-propeller fold protein YncE